MDLTTTTIATAGDGDGDGDENPEDGEVGIISFSEKNLPCLKITRHSLPALNYRECLKNHAAKLGGYAVDGCGEFLPSPAATPSEPRSLECAACGCHRNFHRLDDDSVSTPAAAQFLSFRRNPIPIPLLPRAPQQHMLIHPIRSGAPEDQGTVILNNAHQPSTPPEFKTAENPNGRKRHRTKFTRDQKEKMLCFAERLGCSKVVLSAFDEDASLYVLDHPILNFIYYMLVEILPSALVLFILRKLPPKRISSQYHPIR